MSGTPGVSRFCLARPHPAGSLTQMVGAQARSAWMKSETYHPWHFEVIGFYGPERVTGTPDNPELRRQIDLAPGLTLSIQQDPGHRLRDSLIRP